VHRGPFLDEAGAFGYRGFMDAPDSGKGTAGSCATELLQRRRAVLPEEIAAVVRAVADACAGEPDVVLAFVHGSAIRGGPAADFDVGVFLSDPAGSDATKAYDVCDRVAWRIEQAHVTSLPLDIRPVNGAGPAFRFDLISRGRLAYRRSEDDRVVTEAEWASEWHDFRPFHERLVEASLRGKTP
jgi:predicted nucleotidyltransferase